MQGYKHLKCKPEELPNLLASYKEWEVTSCYYDEEDKMLHLVVLQ